MGVLHMGLDMDFSKWPKYMKVRGLDKLKYLIESDRKRLKYTPKDIVDDMLDLLPKELWSNPSATFLDICSKSGVFLDRIYWRLELGLEKIIPDDLDRSDHIITKQIFGLSLSKEMAEISRGVVYGTYRANHPNAFTMQFKDESGNIKVMERNVDTNIKHNYEDILKDETGQLFRDTVKEAFGDMKFDVVVGNPPYNKGMDLDFVNLGFNLCQKYCVMITPAKWQTAADDYTGCASKTIDYKGFREQLVPHMSKVVFYPDCKDIFDIGQRDGITYYLLNKNKTFNKCEVVNKSILQRHFNGKEIREIRGRQSLLNKGNEIYNYVASNSNFSQFKFNVGNGKYQVWTNTQCPVGGGVGGGAGKGGYAFASDGTAQYISISRVIDISKGEKSPSGASQCTFSSANRAECESFVSWLNTKFTRFFVAINVSKLTGILTDDYFRFVPAPPSGKFDHIYTDEELYKAFNLPQKYIDVIEAVVKERK